MRKLNDETRRSHLGLSKGIESPTPSDDEVLIKPSIRDPDMQVLHHSFSCSKYLVIPGHKFANRVVALAKGLKHVEESHFVAVDPSFIGVRCRSFGRGYPNYLAPNGLHKSRIIRSNSCADNTVEAVNVMSDAQACRSIGQSFAE